MVCWGEREPRLEVEVVSSWGEIAVASFVGGAVVVDGIDRLTAIRRLQYGNSRRCCAVNLNRVWNGISAISCSQPNNNKLPAHKLLLASYFGVALALCSRRPLESCPWITPSVIRRIGCGAVITAAISLVQEPCCLSRRPRFRHPTT